VTRPLPEIGSRVGLGLEEMEGGEGADRELAEGVHTIRPYSSIGYKSPAPQTRTMIPAVAFAGGNLLD